jgi:hypothetical protein
MTRPPSRQCRAEEQGYVIHQGRDRVLVQRQCARRTRNENCCCWQHQEWAEKHSANQTFNGSRRLLQH